MGLAMVHAGGIGRDGKPIITNDSKSSEGGVGGSIGGDGASGGVGGSTTGYRVVNKSFLATGRWEVLREQPH